MNEDELESIARSLGDRAAARLDVEGTATAVLARLRAHPAVAAPAWWASPTLLRLAAAVAITVGAGLLGYRALVRTPGGEPIGVPVAALQTLAPDELEEVLDSLSVDAPAYENVAVGLHDLNAEQLTQLLQRMEG